MKGIYILALALAVTLFACGNTNDPQPSGSVGKYDFSSVDKFIQQNLGAYNNRVAVLITQNNEVIYRREINMTVNTTFGIASASKWLSAGVIMALVDDNKLSLDDNIGKYLPIFNTYHKGDITIRQLFSHTAGFAGDINADGSQLREKFEYRGDLTLAQAVDSIAVYAPLLNKPGTTFNYGSTSMQIAGRIAEVVSGKSWQAVFNEKIAQPCHMSALYLQMSTQNPLIAGGVRTSAANYINFLKMLASRGTFNGTRVLSESSVIQMTTDQTRNATIQGTPYPSNPFATNPLTVVRYGIGNWLDVTDATGNVTEESSSPGLFGTHPWQSSKHHIAGIIFTQTTPKKSNAISLRIRQMVREIIEKGS